MNSGSRLFLVTLLLVAKVAWAKTGNFEQIQITPVQVANPYDLTTRTFSGNICFHRVPTSAVPVACGTLSEVTQTHTLRFFYPSLETEVTSSVTLASVGGTSGVTYNYEASIPEGNTTPVLFVVTELTGESLVETVRQERALEAQIASYAPSSPPSALTQQLNTIRNSLKEDYPAAIYEHAHPKRGLVNAPTRFTTHNRNYRIEARTDRSWIIFFE